MKIYFFGANNDLKRNSFLCEYQTENKDEFRKLFNRIKRKLENFIDKDSIFCGKKSSLSECLQIYMKDSKEPNRSDKLILDEILMILWDMDLAGNDTMITAINWLIINLSIHKKYKKILCEEVWNNLNTSQPHSYHMKQLHFTMAFLSETLRLYCPVPFAVPHRALDNINIGDYFNFCLYFF